MSRILKRETTGLVEAIREHGSITHASKALGIPRGTMRSRIEQIFVQHVRSAQPTITPAEEHYLQRVIKSKDKELAAALAREAETLKKVEILAGFKESRLNPPRWLTPKVKAGKEHAIATAFLSDTHFDEVVSAEQVNFQNAYSREIARMRLEKFFSSTLRLSRDYMTGIRVDTLVLILGGDMVSGTIHEELAETNEGPILPTCLYWADQIAAGIKLLLGAFEHVYVPCVVGNHGRKDKKPRAKNKVYDNYDWLIYKLLQRHFEGEPRVQFNVPAETEARWNVYNTRYLLTHGDRFKGGEGIGGIAVPIMRGFAKLLKQEAASGVPFDIGMCGHFHSRYDLGWVLVNGTLKGWDEWTKQMGFEFQVPQLHYWLTDPQHGKTITAPIHVCDPVAEGWRKEGQVDALSDRRDRR